MKQIQNNTSINSTNLYTVQFLFDYSTVISQIGSVCTQMVEQIQSEFYSSLAQFTEHGFTEANAYKSKLEEASTNYDAALTKIDDMSKKGKLDGSKMNSVRSTFSSLLLFFLSPSSSHVFIDGRRVEYTQGQRGRGYRRFPGFHGPFRR